MLGLEQTYEWICGRYIVILYRIIEYRVIYSNIVIEYGMYSNIVIYSNIVVEYRIYSNVVIEYRI